MSFQFSLKIKYCIYSKVWDKSDQIFKVKGENSIEFFIQEKLSFQNLRFYEGKLKVIPFPCYCKRSQKAGMGEFHLPIFNFTSAVSFISQNQCQCCTIINWASFKWILATLMTVQGMKHKSLHSFLAQQNKQPGKPALLLASPSSSQNLSWKCSVAPTLPNHSVNGCCFLNRLS